MSGESKIGIQLLRAGGRDRGTSTFDGGAGPISKIGVTNDDSAGGGGYVFTSALKTGAVARRRPSGPAPRSGPKIARMARWPSIRAASPAWGRLVRVHADKPGRIAPGAERRPISQIPRVTAKRPGLSSSGLRSAREHQRAGSCSRLRLATSPRAHHCHGKNSPRTRYRRCATGRLERPTNCESLDYFLFFVKNEPAPPAWPPAVAGRGDCVET